MPHATQADDFYALESVRDLYEAEIIELVLTASGGAEALVFDHTLRSDSRDVRGARRSREPAHVIHNDYTDASAVQRLRDLLPAAEAEERLRHRFAIVNVWRSDARGAAEQPLACCDACYRPSTWWRASAAPKRMGTGIGDLESGTLLVLLPEMHPDEAC